MNELTRSPLGRVVAGSDSYDASLLFAIERAAARRTLDASLVAPFGVDVWNAWELSWLEPGGKPCVAIARLDVPADSPNLVESKSLKLYLNSFAQSAFADAGAVQARIRTDLQQLLQAPVQVTLVESHDFPAQTLAPLAGQSIDALPVEIADYDEPQPALLQCDPKLPAGEYALVTDLFRSVCPVTGQPDFASIQVQYRGAAIDPAALLRYLVSFRRHSGFHEHCIERIYADLMQRCAPQQLLVHGRFTRRGGIDINPCRSSHPVDAVNPRSARQ